MHIIIDRTLTMYSLHDICKLIVTASLHRKNNPECSRAASTLTHGFSLFIYLHHANATILWVVYWLWGLLTRHIATTFTFELIPHILTVPILSPFLFIPSLYASFFKFVGFFIYLSILRTFMSLVWLARKCTGRVQVNHCTLLVLSQVVLILFHFLTGQ